MNATAETSATAKAKATKVPGKDGRPIGVGDKVKRWCPLYAGFKRDREIVEIDGDRVHLHYLNVDGHDIGDDGWYIAGYEVQLDD